MPEPKISRGRKVELYNKLVASHSDAVLKGATIPYTSLNGYMYSFIAKENVVALRLPAGERVKFLEKYETKLVEQYGIVQKEYGVVPDSLLEKTNELNSYFDISYNCVNSLKTKPTTKSKKKN